MQLITSVDSTAVRDWLLDCRAAGRSPRTIDAYRRTALAFLQFSDGEMSRRTVRDWLAAQSDKAPASQRLYLTVLRMLARWLVEEKILTEDPTERLRTPKVTAGIVTPLTAGELAALVRAVQGRLRDEAILRMLMSSGMRISECAGILLDNLDMDRQCVLILGKGVKWRTAPFDDKAAQAIARYLRRERGKSPFAEDPRLWLGERGPIGAHGIDRLLRRAAVRAGIKDVHAHRFRHGFADSWLSAGGSEGGLMSVAGWSSRSMLDRYSAARATDRALDEYRRLKR